MLIKNGQGFLESEKVEVFPSAYRGYNEDNTIQFDPKAKLNLEENFIKAGSGVNNLIQSYIIDWTADTLMCMIAGYSFKLNLDRATLIADPTFQNKNVYLKIKLRRVDTLGTSTFVLGDVAGLEGKADLDNSDPDNPNSIVKYFTGLAIIPEGTQITEPNTYTLRILKDNGEIETLNTLPHIVSGSGENSVCANRQNINPYYKDATHNGVSNLDRKQEITDNDPPIASGGWSFAANRGQAEGVSAAAFGVAAAKGPQSFAAGGRAEATEEMSVAFNQAKSNAPGAFAANTGTADGNFSAAFNSARATGEKSFATGQAIAEGEHAFAGGASAEAIGNYSFAFGVHAARKVGLKPSKLYPIKAKGIASFAIGKGTNANGTASFAAGELSTANADYAAALGFEAEASGEKSFSANSSKAQGILSTAFNTAIAVGDNSFAVNDAQVEGDNSFACGGATIMDYADYSFAGGKSGVANCPGSFAFGDNALTGADNQACFGINNTLHDTALLVVGNGKGGYDESTGKYNTSNILEVGAGANHDTVNIIGKLVLGDTNTTATGAYSFAGGKNATANGDYSFAFGEGVIADTDNLVAIGKYNMPFDQTYVYQTYDRSPAKFIIGRGKDAKHLDNVFTVTEQNAFIGACPVVKADTLMNIKWYNKDYGAESLKGPGYLLGFDNSTGGTDKSVLRPVKMEDLRLPLKGFKVHFSSGIGDFTPFETNMYVTNSEGNKVALEALFNIYRYSQEAGAGFRKTYEVTSLGTIYFKYISGAYDSMPSVTQTNEIHLGPAKYGYLKIAPLAKTIKLLDADTDEVLDITTDFWFEPIKMYSEAPWSA